MKKYLLIIGVILLGFGARSAHAAIILNSGFTPHDPGIATPISSGNQGLQDLGNWTATTYTTSTVQLGYNIFSVCSGGGGNVNLQLYDNTAGQSIWSKSSASTTVGINYVDLDAGGNSHTLTNGHDILMVWNCSGGGSGSYSGNGTNPTFAISDNIDSAGHAELLNYLTGSGGGSAAVSFLYPINNTTTPRFNKFALDFSNLIATHTYYGNVTYFVPQVTPQQSNLVGSLDSSNPDVTIVTSTELIATIPFTINTTILTTTGTLFYAEGDLIDSTECFNSLTSPSCVTASTTITFTVLPTCSVYGCVGSATTTGYFVYGAVSGTTPGVSLHHVTVTNNTTGNFQIGGLASSSAFSASVCPAPGGFTDWGGGLNYALCSTINFLFVPSSIITDQVVNQQLAIQNDFPFNMVYGVLNSIQTASNNAGNSTSSALTLNIWGMSLPVLNSSTLSGFVGTSNKNLIFSTEDTIAWVSVASTILKVIF